MRQRRSGGEEEGGDRVFTGRRRERRLSVHMENKGEDEKIREGVGR
jgi:hypothetical protein